MNNILNGQELAAYFSSKQLDELNKSTLQSYTAKAVGSKSGLDFMRGVKMAQGSGGEEELRAKSEKRSEGIHRAIKKIAEGHVPDDHGRYISDSDKRTLGKLADLMQKERPKKKPQTPEEIKQSVKEASDVCPVCGQTPCNCTGIQLDEISTAAKQNYINAAALDVARTGNMLGRAQVGKSKTSANTSGKRIEKRLQGIATATSKLTKEDVEQIDEISDELATKVGMARTANVNKAGEEYRKTAFQGDDVRKTALDKLKAAEAKRSKGGKIHIARSDRKFKSFMKAHNEKMAARSPEQVKKDNEAENAERHKNYKERGWTLD